MNCFIRTNLIASVLAFALPLIAAGQEKSGVTEFCDLINTHFKAWDKNGDGELSPEELDAAVADGKIQNREAAAVAALKRTMRNAKGKLPPLTKDEILKLAQAKPGSEKHILSYYRTGLVKLEKQPSRELFADGPPKLATIHQGRLGNCFCLAPLGALVSRDPEEVVHLFALQKDGRYLVKLGHHEVTIAAPTDAEIILMASNEKAGLWVNLYEKAVGEARGQDRPAGQKSTSPIDEIARGGSAGTMVEFITGHKIVRFSCAFAKEPGLKPAVKEAKLKELRELLDAAQSEKRLMTIGTLKTTTPGLTPNHAYAVLKYDAAADSVTLWNPHGGSFKPKGMEGLANGYGMTNGTFPIPLGDLVEQFSGLAFETKEAAERKK